MTGIAGSPNRRRKKPKAAALSSAILSMSAAGLSTGGRGKTKTAGTRRFRRPEGSVVGGIRTRTGGGSSLCSTAFVARTSMRKPSTSRLADA